MLFSRAAVVSAAIALLSAPAAAQTPAARFEAWLCATAPSTPACRTRAVPTPPAKPAEIKPAPKAQRTGTAPTRTQRRNSKSKAPSAPNQQQRETLSGGGQAAPAPVTCTPLPPKDCRQICFYARRMSAAAGEELGVAMGYCRPTPRQRAAGKGCVRSHCPEALETK